LLVDVSELAQVEHDYGSRAFENVLSMVSVLVAELRGSDVRSEDLLALSERGGNAFLLFLSPRRTAEEGPPASASSRRWLAASPTSSTAVWRASRRPTCAAGTR